jgi:phage/plasmid-like protein (TIGR03299 family)
MSTDSGEGLRIEEATSPLWSTIAGQMVMLDDVATADQIMQRAALDWAVEQRPIYAEAGPDGRSWRPVQSHVANLRADTGALLGVVGRDYRPVQNRTALELAEAIIDASGAHWVCAGATRGGARVHALLRLPREVRIGSDDSERILPLLRISNGHDGGLALTVTVTPLRLVCLNGMLIDTGGARRTWKLRHTARVDGRIQDARRALGLSFAYYDELERLGEQLLAEPMPAREFERFLTELVPFPAEFDPSRGGRRVANVERVRAAIREARSADDLANVRETRWGALQAVTGYVTHIQPARGTRSRTISDARFERVTSPAVLVDRATRLLTAT